MKIIIITVLMTLNILAGEIIEMLPYKHHEFSPILKQHFQIPFTLKKEAKVTVEIYTPDNTLIRTLQSRSLKEGEQSVVWDGKDSHGTIVPNEAYNIVLIAQSSDQKEVIDPRMSGGEIIKNLQTKLTKQGSIVYHLSAPSRVLVRAGIENGPMLRVISNWIPKNSGKVLQRWNMRDVDNMVDISHLKFSVSVTAFALPKYTIITTNNKKLNYFEYFTQNGFTCPTIDQEEQLLIRDDKGISKHFYSCRIQDRDPRVNLEIPNAPKKEVPILQNGKQTLIKVTMHPEDEAIFEKAKYEVSFFIDFKFSSEEELGYMPISWNFNPNALKKGEHVLSVNISTFQGQVGVRSLKFLVE